MANAKTAVQPIDLDDIERQLRGLAANWQSRKSPEAILPAKTSGSAIKPAETTIRNVPGSASVANTAASPAPLALSPVPVPLPLTQAATAQVTARRADALPGLAAPARRDLPRPSRAAMTGSRPPAFLDHRLSLEPNDPRPEIRPRSPDVVSSVPDIQLIPDLSLAIRPRALADRRGFVSLWGISVTTASLLVLAGIGAMMAKPMGWAYPFAATSKPADLASASPSPKVEAAQASDVGAPQATPVSAGPVVGDAPPAPATSPAPIREAAASASPATAAPPPTVEPAPATAPVAAAVAPAPQPATAPAPSALPLVAAAPAAPPTAAPSPPSADSPNAVAATQPTAPRNGASQTAAGLVQNAATSANPTRTAMLNSLFGAPRSVASLPVKPDGSVGGAASQSAGPAPAASPVKPAATAVPAAMPPAPVQRLATSPAESPQAKLLAAQFGPAHPVVTLAIKSDGSPGPATSQPAGSSSNGAPAQLASSGAPSLVGARPTDGSVSEAALTSFVGTPHRVSSVPIKADGGNGASGPPSGNAAPAAQPAKLASTDAAARSPDAARPATPVAKKRADKPQDKAQPAKPNAALLRSQKAKRPSKPMALQVQETSVPKDAPQSSPPPPQPPASGPLSSIGGFFRKAIATTGIVQP